jgi:hypothetical protein
VEDRYEVGVSPAKDYVYARAFSVPYTAELALAVAAELARFGQDVGASGCLVDIRGTASVAGVSEKWDFAHTDTKIASLPRNWRYAFLADRRDEKLALVEKFMRDAGYDFLLFENERRATDWLKEAESD